MLTWQVPIFSAAQTLRHAKKILPSFCEAAPHTVGALVDLFEVEKPRSLLLEVGKDAGEDLGTV